MDQLTKLAKKYGTDKWGKHHYTPVYHDLFKDKRNEVTKVLEIGIAEGAGLRMFRDYFPNATIFGGDNEEARLLTEDRIESYWCDQSDAMDMFDLASKVGYGVDLIVDDGSHKREDQILTCKAFMQILASDGIYVIEDVSDPTIVKELANFDCYVLEVGKRYDDRLVIVRHKENEGFTEAN